MDLLQADGFKAVSDTVPPRDVQRIRGRTSGTLYPPKRYILRAFKKDVRHGGHI